jgi:hypothetical protein
VKVGGKQSNRLAEISDYGREKKEMEDINSVPIGSPVERDERPPVPVDRT